MRTGHGIGLLAAGGITLAAGLAQAQTYSWNFTRNMPQPPGGSYGINDDAGRIETISTTFNTNTKVMTFDVLFGPVNGSIVTRGYWLALNNGPNPKSNPGEMAIFYFDASLLTAPILTTYVYNGVNGPNSWSDGNGSAAGAPLGDLIKGSREMMSYVQSISAQDIASVDGTRRLMRMTLDTTAIINHVPQYPSPVGDPWFGTGFDSRLGIWMHPVRSINAGYEQSGRGRITSLSLGTQGWLDGTNFMTQVPAPGTLALAGVGGTLVARRRRR